MKPAPALALLLLSAAFIQTGGAASALSYTSLNSSFLDGSNRMIGWQFTVTQAIDISALGWFDWGLDGLNLSHEVGIWNTTGSTLITSEVVPAGTAATLVDGFRYITLTAPVTLQTGQTYAIAGYDIGSSGDPHVWDVFISGFSNQVNGFTTDPRIGLNAAIGSLAGSFGYPSGTIGDARKALMGPNFVIVPEPSAAVFLLGGGVIALLRRRRK